jgi:DNA repair exonuclease SbcCD ATPase subunit
MARNLFGAGPRKGTNKKQEERERSAREQEQRRRAQQERQRAALRGDADPQYPMPTMEEADGEEDAPPVTVARPQSYRQADDVRRDDSRTMGLQNQIDELRLIVREISESRERERETARAQEAEIAQLKIALESARQEMTQSAQAVSMNENRTRQQLEDLEERLDDSMRPIRSLQAHVTDLLEQSRRKVDDTTQNKERYAEIMTNIEHLTAMSDRTTAIAHGLRDNIDSVRSAIDELRRDVIRTDDSIKIVDQEARRRVQSVSENIDGFTSRMDELRSDLSHTYEAIEDTKRGLVHVDPTLDELRADSVALRGDLSKLQSQVDIRHDQVIDLQDEARQETDARFDQLRHTLEERIERLNERLEETNEVFRETTYKISEINAQVEDLRQTDTSLHRDIWYLHEQRVRVRLEQVQEELDLATAQRRDAESEARVGLGSRVRRRRGDDSSQ